MSDERPPTALTVAGTDSGGGAGIAADLKTFEAHGVWGLVAVAAVTAQDTTGVLEWASVPADLVAAQVRAVADDIGVDAVKTGMLGDAEVVEAVAGALGRVEAPLVVDPVLRSGHGDALAAEGLVEALRDLLLPKATLVTPNLVEAAALTGGEVPADPGQMEQAGRAVLDLGPAAVLVKGGHLGGTESSDCLVTPEGVQWLDGPRLDAVHLHGTGCVLSSAVAARLARGEELADAVGGAKAFVTEAIHRGRALGRGVGPVDPGPVLGAGLA